MPLKPGRARALYPKEIKHAVKVAGVCQNPIRNQLVLLLSHCCGLRITEIARLRVRDVMFASGELREELRLPAAITKSSRARIVWLSHRQLQQTLDSCVRYRTKKRLATTLDASRYRGLNPDSKLILNNRGTAFSLQPKPRLLETGEVRTYWAADSLDQAMRNLYKRCGLKGCSSHSGRRSFGTNLITVQGVELDVVSRLLGHSDPAHTIPYIEIRSERVKAMYACALD